MKNTVLMLLLCAYCGVVQAQDYFIKTININETSSDNGFNVIADETGYMVMCGSLFNGNTSSGVGIFKTDLQGDKILENAFSTALDTHAYDFLKMTNITLGYNIPLKSSKFVKNIRAYVSADNLFCITGYDGLDPEMSNGDIWSLGIMFY